VPADDCVVLLYRTVFGHIHLFKCHVIMTCRANPLARNLKGGGIEIDSMQLGAGPDKTRCNQ